MIDTQSIIPENSASPKHTRFGLSVPVNADGGLLYLGERIYFLSSEDDFTPVQFKAGAMGGAYLGVSRTPNRVCCQVDTLDGYFGVVTEAAIDRWGLGLEYNHFSAHYSDGRFLGVSPKIINEYHTSFRGSFSPIAPLNIQVWLHIFDTDMPQNRIIAIEPALRWNVLPELLFEVFVRTAPLRSGFQSLRTKFSYWVFTSHGQLIPYILLHQGDHYYGQRFTEQVTQVLLGVEVNF